MLFRFATGFSVKPADGAIEVNTEALASALLGFNATHQAVYAGGSVNNPNEWSVNLNIGNQPDDAEPDQFVICMVVQDYGTNSWVLLSGRSNRYVLCELSENLNVTFVPHIFYDDETSSDQEGIEVMAFSALRSYGVRQKN